jgi:hypothetical protein
MQGRSCTRPSRMAVAPRHAHCTCFGTSTTSRWAQCTGMGTPAYSFKRFNTVEQIEAFNPSTLVASIESTLGAYGTLASKYAVGNYATFNYVPRPVVEARREVRELIKLEHKAGGMGEVHRCSLCGNKFNTLRKLQAGARSWWLIACGKFPSSASFSSTTVLMRSSHTGRGPPPSNRGNRTGCSIVRQVSPHCPCPSNLSQPPAAHPTRLLATTLEAPTVTLLRPTAQRTGHMHSHGNWQDQGLAP